ncbi:MAG: hypothetical protein RMX68_032755 [Aulosira sp. ZfuVER01]|nr:hypothetical protein [Aulosira sp. DedVER01a]
MLNSLVSPLPVGESDCIGVYLGSDRSISHQIKERSLASYS